MLAEGDARFVRGFDTAMLHPGTQVQHALTATLVAVLLGACTAHDPIADVAPADMRCPELSGSYCAAGRMYDRSQTQLLSARLQLNISTLKVKASILSVFHVEHLYN